MVLVAQPIYCRHCPTLWWRHLWRNTVSILYNKKLSYRKGTARRAMLVVNSFYVSRDMGVRKASSTKVTFMVIQGPWLWSHSIGHIQSSISASLQLCLYLAPLTRYYHSLPKIWRGNVSPNTSFSEVIYQACTSTPVYQ